MKKSIFSLGAAAMLTIGGCAVNPNTGNVGLSSGVTNGHTLSCVGGAVVGLVLANQIGDITRSSNEGEWKAAAGLAGCALGSHVYDLRSATSPAQISDTLRNAPTGSVVEWENSVGGQTHQYSVRPTSNVRRDVVANDNNRYAGCREYEVYGIDPVTKRSQKILGQACMDAQGNMRLIM